MLCKVFKLFLIIRFEVTVLDGGSMAQTSTYTIVGEGIILGYRRGNLRQNTRQVYLKVTYSTKALGNLVGCKVIVKDRYGNTYRGKIVKVHSWRNSVVICVFEPRLPGQLIGSVAQVLS